MQTQATRVNGSLPEYGTSKNSQIAGTWASRLAPCSPSAMLKTMSGLLGAEALREVLRESPRGENHGTVRRQCRRHGIDRIGGVPLRENVVDAGGGRLFVRARL